MVRLRHAGGLFYNEGLESIIAESISPTNRWAYTLIEVNTRRWKSYRDPTDRAYLRRRYAAARALVGVVSVISPLFGLHPNSGPANSQFLSRQFSGRIGHKEPLRMGDVSVRTYTISCQKIAISRREVRGGRL